MDSKSVLINLKSAVFAFSLLALCGCQAEPLAESIIKPDLIPLTIEQALPASISTDAIRKRGGCYYYLHKGQLILIKTLSAPGALETCDD
jgi:hypothetical protein